MRPSTPARLAMFWKDARTADVELWLCTVPYGPPLQQPLPLLDSPGKSFLMRLLCMSSAPFMQQLQPPPDSLGKSFLLNSLALVSASPYFKTRCWSDNAEGQLQYTDGGHTVRAPAVGQAAFHSSRPLLLLEYVEEEELPAMEAVLCHCYTEELCNVGGDASELSVALLVQMLVLSNRCAESSSL